MAGVDDDRQMGFLLEDGHHRKVQRVAGVFFKRADAALAENDVFIAAGHDVLRAHDPFLDGIGKPALEQHRLFHFAHGLQKLEVLHIARTDLHKVHIFLKFIDLVLAHQLADDGHAGRFTRRRHGQNALCAKALERIGRGARLVRAAAQHAAARVLHFAGNAHGLLLALDAARPADDGDLFAAAHLDAAHVDDAVRLVKQAVRLFVRLGHTLHVFHIRVRPHLFFVDNRRVAHQAEHIVIRAADHGDGQALRLKLADDLIQFRRRSAPFCADDHCFLSPLLVGLPRAARQVRPSAAACHFRAARCRIILYFKYFCF